MNGRLMLAELVTLPWGYAFTANRVKGLDQGPIRGSLAVLRLESPTLRAVTQSFNHRAAPAPV